MVCSSTSRLRCGVGDGGKHRLRNQPINKLGVSSSIVLYVFFACMAMLVSTASAFSVPQTTSSGRMMNDRYMSSNLIADNGVADDTSMTLNPIDTMLLEKVKDTSIHMIQHHQSICQFHDQNAVKIKRTLNKMSPNASFATTLKALREHRFPSQPAEDEEEKEINPAKNPFGGQTPTSSYLDALSQHNIDGSDVEAFDDQSVRSNSNDNNNNKDPLILVDVSAYLHQVYYSMPPLFRKDGMPINAVLAFCNMLNHLTLERLLKGEQPRVALVFDPADGASFTKDSKIGGNFRQDLHPNYKAERPDVPVDLLLQLALIQEVAVAFGIPQLMTSHKYEADDVIATLTTANNKNIQPATTGSTSGDGINTRNVNIVSGDSDLMQLVNTVDEASEHHCHMIHPLTLENIDDQAVVNKWGVPASKLGDMMALVGKSTNGIPGVSGIGQKIAAQLITEHGSLEELYQGVVFIRQTKRREKLINFEAQAKLSRKLLQLDRSVPFGDIVIVKGENPAEELQSLDDLKMEAMDVHRILDLYRDMEFSDIRYRLPSP